MTAAILGPDDVLKVIDQGSDDTTNAVSIRKFFAKTAGVRTTTRTAEATVIQTRHRIPETALAAHQVLVYQVPIPEPLRFLEIISPGGFAQYFRELAPVLAAGDHDGVQKIAARYELEIDFSTIPVLAERHSLRVEVPA